MTDPLAQPTARPLRVAIVGAGGFAGVHQSAIASLEQSGAVRLIGTCDPASKILANAAVKWDYARRGVRTFPDYRAMLAAQRKELDALLVPTPVPLHAEMHRAGVEHGLPLYLEKPPTLDGEELEAMIAVDRNAVRTTNVGFNHIVEPVRRTLKRRLCSGEFGTLREVRFLGLSGRPEEYYARNHWAGRLLLGNQIVIDSCLSNAMAHYVHNALFWAGVESEMTWAAPTEVEATLGRAHTIESADTVLVAARTATGVRLRRLGLSHAWDGPDLMAETLVCDRATIHYRVGQRAEIVWSAGDSEVIPTAAASLQDNLQAWFSYLREEVPRPPTTLADCRPFVLLNSLAILSGEKIYTLEHERRSRRRGTTEEIFRVARDIEHRLEAFVDTGRWPGPPPARIATAADLPQLRALLRSLTEDSPRASSSAT